MSISNVTYSSPVNSFSDQAPEVKSEAPPAPLQTLETKTSVALEEQSLSAQNLKLKLNQVYDQKEANTSSKNSIPTYDPAIGPQITNAMWTPEMLAGDFSSDLLRNMVDPAGFLNARVAALSTPTNAKAVDLLGGTAPQSLNPSELSTRKQAEAMLERLRGLGYGGEGIVENKLDGTFYKYDYGDETRRTYNIGGMNVGLLADRYARFPREVADQMTRDELNYSQNNTSSFADSGNSWQPLSANSSIDQYTYVHRPESEVRQNYPGDKPKTSGNSQKTIPLVKTNVKH